MARAYPQQQQDDDQYGTAPIRRLKVTYTDYQDVVEGESNAVDSHVIAILQHFKNRGVVGSTVRVSVPGGDDLTYEVEA